MLPEESVGVRTSGRVSSLEWNVSGDVVLLRGDDQSVRLSYLDEDSPHSDPGEGAGREGVDTVPVGGRVENGSRCFD